MLMEVKVTNLIVIVTAAAANINNSNLLDMF